MNQVTALSRLQRARDLLSDSQSLRKLERPIRLDVAFKVLPLDELHHIEVVFAILTEVKYSSNVRMTQGRGCAGFAQKALPSDLAMQNVRRDYLQSDVAMQVCVQSLVGDAHAAAPKLPQHPVFSL